MMAFVAATAQQKQSISVPVVLIVFLIGGVIYLFGYARAVMHRANRDYKTTKAAVPVLRKGFWKTWWAAFKVGFWVLIAAAIMVTWVGRDLRGQPADATPSPSVSVAKTTHPHR
jgi:arginine exporter protein ArgO